MNLRFLHKETQDFEGFKRLCIVKLESLRLLSQKSPTGRCLVVCDVAGLSIASFVMFLFLFSFFSLFWLFQADRPSSPLIRISM